MEYQGKLYGKIGDKYFDTGKTTDDFDNLEKELNSIKKVNNHPCIGCKHLCNNNKYCYADGDGIIPTERCDYYDTY